MSWDNAKLPNRTTLPNLVGLTQITADSSHLGGPCEGQENRAFCINTVTKSKSTIFNDSHNNLQDFKKYSKSQHFTQLIKRQIQTSQTVLNPSTVMRISLPEDSVMDMSMDCFKTGF